MTNKELVHPFSGETAAAKLQFNENIWNSHDSTAVAELYSENVEWGDRCTFLKGRDAVKNYMTEKFAAQRNYKVKKEVWGAKENRNAIRFEEEWLDQNGQWFHSYGNELLQFDANGLIQKRFGCINDEKITDEKRSL